MGTVDRQPLSLRMIGQSHRRGHRSKNAHPTANEGKQITLPSLILAQRRRDADSGNQGMCSRAMGTKNMQAKSLQADRGKTAKARFLAGMVIQKRERRRFRRHRKARAYARLFLLAAHLALPTPVAAQAGLRLVAGAAGECGTTSQAVAAGEFGMARYSSVGRVN